MGEIFNLVLINPLTEALKQLTIWLGGNLGLGIVALTLIIKLITWPLTVPSIRTAKKMQELKPHLDKIKKKHKDKGEQQKKQMELYKKHGVNPAAGCLPQILQLVVLIGLYQVLIRFVNTGVAEALGIGTTFLWLDLAKADPYYILPVAAGGLQFVLGRMMKPAVAANPKGKDGKGEDAMQAMQTQMMWVMPFFTVFIALRFPSALVLYWVISSLLAVLQQWVVGGGRSEKINKGDNL